MENWRNSYKKNCILSAKATKELIKKYNNPRNDSAYYSNLGIEELSNDTFFYPIFLGMTTNDDGQIKNVYRVHRGNKEEIVIVGFKAPTTELKTASLGVINKITGECDEYLTVYHGEKQIEAEIAINIEDDGNLSLLVMDTLSDYDKDYETRINELNDGLNRIEYRKTLCI
jgi:hypothetical protein